MDSDERREVVKRFWGRVEKVVGLVPRRVMGLLDLLEMSASQLIARAGTDWAACIETRIKANGEAMFEAAKERGFTRTKSEVFGLHHDSLGTFELYDYEKASIEDIRKLIQDNGIRSYINESPVRVTRQPNPPSGILTPGQSKQMLLDKLAGYYRSRKNLGISSNFFVNLQVQESENQAIVRVPCPKCNQKPGCTRSGNTWLTNNYYQHVRTHLRKELEVRSSRRSGRFGGPSRRPSGVGTRQRGLRRSLTSQSMNEDGEDEESDEGVQQGASPEEVSDAVAGRSSQGSQAQSVTADTAGKSGESAQQGASSREGIGSVEGLNEEQAAGSGDDGGQPREQAADNGEGDSQPTRKKSVNELVRQFSEGTSRHPSRSKDTSEN